MSNAINILILSCGTRNKIVQYFKKSLGGRGQVIAADCSELAPALYDADKYFIVPRMNDEAYLDSILTICKENNIKGVLSLIDPELSLLAEKRGEFLDIGTVPIISDYDLVKMCFDKFKFYELLIKNGYKTIKSYIDKDLFYSDVKAGLLKYPIFVKPVRGSASINISRVNNKEELDLLLKTYDNLMIQEFMDGAEYGADVYVDLISGETVSIFIKEKLKMRAGETDKSVSVKDLKLFDLIADFVKSFGFRGIIDIDIFKVNGEFYISEVNPRFGGGYPHAFECGVNVPEMIINNLENKVNIEMNDNYESGVFMMKYNELKII